LRRSTSRDRIACTCASGTAVPLPPVARECAPLHSNFLESIMASTDSLPIEIDGRVIPPRERQPKIFHTFDSLGSGESLMIVNDHDPRPLRYQFAAERPETFEWTYLE